MGQSFITHVTEANKLSMDMARPLQDTSPLPSILQRGASLEVEDVRSELHAAAEPAEPQAAEALAKTASHKTTGRWAAWILSLHAWFTAMFCFRAGNLACCAGRRLTQK